MNRIQRRAFFCAALALCALSGRTASAINLQASLANSGGTIKFFNGEPQIVDIIGRTFNADPEGALTAGALRAFYYLGDFVTPRPIEAAIRRLNRG